jgi:hypothetical protein
MYKNMEAALYDLIQKAVTEDFGGDDSILLETFRELNNDDGCESGGALSTWQNCDENGSVRNLTVCIDDVEYRVIVEKV